MSRYAIMNDTEGVFTGISLELDIDGKVDDKFKLFGEEFTIIQKGVIIVLANKNRVITLQEVDEETE